MSLVGASKSVKRLFPSPPSLLQSHAPSLTLGSGTSHLPAFSLRFCLMVLDSTLARSTCNGFEQKRPQLSSGVRNTGKPAAR